MADKKKFEREDFEAAYDEFSDDFRDALGEEVTKALSVFLVMMGDPKNYRGYAGLAQAMTDNVLMWMVMENHVTLNESAQATDEEKGGRPVRPSVANQLGGEVEGFLQGLNEGRTDESGPGNYL